MLHVRTQEELGGLAALQEDSAVLVHGDALTLRFGEGWRLECEWVGPHLSSGAELARLMLRELMSLPRPVKWYLRRRTGGLL